MGTTHIKDMRVYGVSCSKTAKPYFLLREKTFEGNCYPHSPHWCTMYFGDWEGLIRRVFGLAETVASDWGLRVGKSTKCNPMDVLCLLRNNIKKNGITLLKANHSISTCNGMRQLTEEQLQHFNQYLATPLIKGSQQINLQDEASAIAEAFKRSGRGFSYWQLFDSSYNDYQGLEDYEHTGGNGQPRLSFELPKGDPKPLEIPPLYKIQYADGHGQNALKVMSFDGVADCRRSYLHHFIDDLIDIELSCYGAADKYVRKIYKLEHNPLILPEHAIVQIEAFSEEGKSHIQAEFSSIPDRRLSVAELVSLNNVNLGGFRNSWLDLGYKSTYLKLVELNKDKGGAIGEAASMPKPQAGLILNYGGADYKLCKHAGPRRGWVVKRCSDGVIFRLSAKQLRQALKHIANTKVQTLPM